MHSIQTFNRDVVALVVNCYYSGDEEALNRLGIDSKMAHKIASLPASVRHRLELQRVPFFNISLNREALNSSIDACCASNDRDELYDKAIQLGAAKSTMYQVCKMSSSKFAARRKALGISDVRVRPQSLTVDEELLLSKVSLSTPYPDTLSELIYLAEKSGIEINRIHTYFILDKEAMA